MLYGLLQIPLGNAAGNLAVPFSSLAQFLSLCGVIGGGQVGRWLLRKDVLDREDFVEQLKLLLGGSAVVVSHFHTIVLKQARPTEG